MDVLAGAGLGLLALAGRMDPTLSTAVEQSLLANAMGYVDDAVALAPTATQDRGFDSLAAAAARQDLATLEARAQQNDLLAAYLRACVALERGADRNGIQQLFEPLRGLGQPPLPFMHLAVQGLPLSQAGPLAQRWPVYVIHLLQSRMEEKLTDVDDVESGEVWPLTRFAQRLEAWSPGGPEAEDGLLQDNARQRAAFQAMYVMAMAGYHNVLANRKSSLNSTGQFLDRLLPHDSAHPLVLLWRGKLLASQGERAQAEEQAAAILAAQKSTWNPVLYSAPQLEPALMYQVFSLVDNYQARHRLAPATAQCLDSRPSGWSTLGMLFHLMQNTDLAEAAYVQALKANAHDFSTVQNLCSLREDEVYFQQARARDPNNLALLQRAAAWNKEHQTPEALQRALPWYNAALALSPDNMTLQHGKAWCLLKLGHLDEAVVMLRQLLARPPQDSLQHARIVACLAEGLLKKGQAQAALDTVTDVMQSYQAGVLTMGVRAYEAVGQTAQAEDWIDRAVARYPNVDHVLAEAAAYYWRKGDWNKAAAYIAQGRPVMGSQYTWYTRMFLETMAPAPPAAVLAAVKALVATGAKPWEIKRLGIRLHRVGKTELALALLQMAPAASASEQLERAVETYPLLRTLKGEDAALAQLMAGVDAKKRGPLAMMLFKHGHYDILLSQYRNPEVDAPGHGEFIHLMRLLAWLSQDREPASLAEEFQSHYQRAKADFYHAVGRLLLGRISEEELLAMVAQPRQRCEAAYYLGLHHRLRGAFDQAAIWYQICLETGLEHNGEYHWALEELSAWSHLGPERRHRLPARDRQALETLD